MENDDKNNLSKQSQKNILQIKEEKYYNALSIPCGYKVN